MGRLLVRFDELIEDSVENQSKVLGLVSRGGFKAFVKASDPYSVIKGCVGERIKPESTYGLYSPVRQADIKAFRVGQDSIKEIIRFGEVDCRYFDEGIGFNEEGSPVDYLTVTRNYVPGLHSRLSGSDMPEDERESIAKGGVYRADECEERDDLALYPIVRSQRDWSGLAFSGPFRDHPLTGINAYSKAFITLLITSSRLYGAGAITMADEGLCYRSIARHLRYERHFFRPYLWTANSKPWSRKEARKTWHGGEVVLDASDGEEALWRPGGRYEYKLCCFPDGRGDLDGAANGYFVPQPERINIKASDLLFLSSERQALLDAFAKTEDTKAGSNDSSGIEVKERLYTEEEPALQELEDMDGYQEGRAIAVKWICEWAKVTEEDLSNADPLINFATIAVMTWKGVPVHEKADRSYCAKLIGAFYKKRDSYSGPLERMITLRFQAGYRSASYRAGARIRRPRDEEVWKMTAVSVLIEAWKKYVFDRSRTARRESRRGWDRKVKAYLDNKQLKDDYFSAAVSVILSDQNKEDMFENFN